MKTFVSSSESLKKLISGVVIDPLQYCRYSKHDDLFRMVLQLFLYESTHCINEQKQC